MSAPRRPARHPDHAQDGTRARIVDAALETLKTRGYAGASAREIAKTGGFNQALIFYHHGNVQGALLAVLDRVSDNRMNAYRPAFEQATTLAELAALAGEIYREDLENGYVTVLAEMVAGGMSDSELGRQVVARIEPWVEMVEHKVRALIAGSMFEPLVPPRDLAFAIIALYLGIDMLGQLDGRHARAESLLELGARGAPLLQILLPPQGKETRDARG
ncbi:MAG TPA: TetR/AcrR family transcriptional regulator [Solirubrobacteraceae bacterium]|nr:TetR/AcrR family transcriptional regulator [Solirubrobacteraceae bacterium]